jgi:hypothetical protein
MPRRKSKLSIKEVQERGRQILARSSVGVRWSDLVDKIATESPDTSIASISRGLRLLTTSETEGISKISRGLYILRSNEEKSTPRGTDPDTLDDRQVRVTTAQGVKTVNEQAFYEPLAEWLKGELGEANEAEALGGNILKGKWGTPDVLGVLKPLKADPIQFAAEFVSAEVKVDANQPIVAFGQAIAYRLFSHKSYIVMPNTIAPDDLDRLEALSVIYGLGLVIFSLDPAAPNFLLKVRAQSVRPDVFYMNQMAKRIREALPKIYEKMF